MTGVSSVNKESFLSRGESLARENTQRIIAFIDSAYDSIEPKDPESDGDLLVERICNGLEDVEKGLRDDINPVRIIQRLWDQDWDQDDSVWITGLGVLIEIAREEKHPDRLKEYKESPKYVKDLDHVSCNRPEILLTQDDESSITTILALPLLAEDILTDLNISNETRRAILHGVYQEIKLRNENKE
jgi:hypothetical protein